MFSNAMMTVAALVICELFRMLFAEGIHAFATKRSEPVVDGSLVMLIVECLKFSFALTIVLASTRDFSIKTIHYFMVQACLLSINSLIFFSSLQRAPAVAASVLLHLRLPIVGAFHHLVARRQTSLATWSALVAIYIGVVVSQFSTDASRNFWAAMMWLVVAVNSSVAAIINEKMLKDFPMPIWDQQLRIYAISVLFSLIVVLTKLDTLVHPESKSAASILSVVGCIAMGVASGILSDLVLFQHDGIIYFIAYSIVTVLGTIGIYFAFGLDSGSFVAFVIGSAILFGTTYVYIQTADKNTTEKSLKQSFLEKEDTFKTGHQRESGIVLGRFRRSFLYVFVVCMSLANLFLFRVYYGWSASYPFNSIGSTSSQVSSNSVKTNVVEADRILPNGHRCFVNPVDVEDTTVNLTGTSVVDTIDAECKHATLKALGNCTIPRVVHFVVGGPFKFHHYISMKSVFLNLKPDVVFVHGEDFPVGQELFDQIMEEHPMTLVQSRKADSIYGHTAKVVEHQSDLVRLESVIRFGGMYFDLDVFVFQDFEPFLKYETVMGEQPGYGLNNGMIVAKRCARFLRRWHRAYAHFDDGGWDDHSVRLPGRLAKEHPEEVHIESGALYNVWPSPIMFKEEHEPETWKPIRAIHSFYRGYDKTHDFEDVKTLKNNYGRFVRSLLYGGPAMGEPDPKPKNTTSPRR